MKSAVVLALVATLALPGATRADDPRSEERERQALALFRRLRAPCCYQQTLDVHESEPANALRAAIRARLASGETVSEVETDLVRAYGDRIRAVQRYDLTRNGCGMASVVLFAILIGLVLLARRWRDRYGHEELSAEADSDGDALLDASLAESED